MTIHGAGRKKTAELFITKKVCSGSRHQNSCSKVQQGKIPSGRYDIQYQEERKPKEQIIFILFIQKYIKTGLFPLPHWYIIEQIKKCFMLPLKRSMGENMIWSMQFRSSSNKFLTNLLHIRWLYDVFRCLFLASYLLSLA